VPDWPPGGRWPAGRLPATPAAFSAGGIRLAASATASIVLTSWALIATETIHPPACATTLIVSLGLLSTPIRVGIIVASVVLLVGFHGPYSACSTAAGPPHHRTTWGRIDPGSDGYSS
jgi:CBS-domain-containing membrane protein